MALVNLPPISIDSTNVPRIRAALQAKYASLPGMGMPNPVENMTDAELYKKWVIEGLQREVHTYEKEQASRTAVAGVAPPPEMT